MRTKNHLLRIVLLALAVSTFVTWYWLKLSGLKDEAGTVSSEETNSIADEPSPISEPGQDTAISNMENDIVWELDQKPSYQMVGAKSSFDPVADAERKKTLPFQMFASGGIGKIVDKDGRIILQSDAKNAIFKFEVSPDLTRIAVHRGSGKYDIITPSSGETIRLPQQPPGENMLGFGSWHWVDERTLVGVSGETIPHKHNHAGNLCEEPDISQSVLYRYDLNERKISQVALPQGIGTKIVSVRAVDEAGRVQLWPDGQGESYTDASLGWFEIRPTE